MIIYAGKKTNIIYLDGGKANLAVNNARMALAEIPGLNIWEMDGAGTQINIGTRGTDAHRSIEMNMNQNGYNINSDIFGYPEAHYTPALQSVKEMQLVRGSAALQFGSQFGGMFNYVMQDADTTRKFGIVSEQTAGSNKFFNSFNSVSGKIGKWTYYSSFDNRTGDGWRKNASFSYQSLYSNITYHFNEKGKLSFQFSRMNYRQQIAGGLTDAQFKDDNKQSTRSRNFFSPIINIPAIIFDYDLGKNTKLQFTSHYLFGERSSVQFIAAPNVADSINKSTNSYNPRQVDRDFYSGFTTEARLLTRYNIGSIKSTLSSGVRYFTELTKRQQKGKGTSNSDFDLNLVKPYGTDLRLLSNNYAVFAENIFQLSPKFSVTPGFRYEIIRTSLTGLIQNASVPISYKGNRDFPLFGTGLQYQVDNQTQLYGNISQAYRPYLYASVTPADRLDVIDPNLKDSKGYDIDLGYRGHFSQLVYFDVNGFYLFYGNRVGLLTQTGANNITNLLTTNIGNSVAKGVEAYFNVSLKELFFNGQRGMDLKVFNSLSYTHARYTSGEINQSGTNVSLTGNRVEGTPDWINRAGLEFINKKFTSTLQISYVGKSFSDANNTIQNAIGSVGVVPSYHVFDWSFNWAFIKNYHLSASVNNILDAKYFTRRINMYPGPGILPADGRTFNIGLGIKL
jgi:Fe(3+) dicitrate transport protein